MKQVHEIPTIPIWYQRLISYCKSLFMTFWYHLNPREAKVNAHSWQIKKNLRLMEVHKPLTLPLKGIPQPRKVCECALSKHSQNLHMERDYQAWTPPRPPFFISFFLCLGSFLYHHFWIYCLLVSLNVLMVEPVLHAWFAIVVGNLQTCGIFNHCRQRREQEVN